MSKRTIVLVGLIFLFVVGAGSYYIFYVRTGTPEFDIRKFKGNIISIEGDIITLKGVFDGSVGTIPQDLLLERNFSFKVDDTTRFEELVIGWPTWDEVRSAGGTLKFSVEDLPQNRETKSWDSFKNTVSLNPGAVYVEVDFTTSIFNSKNPTALLVFYRTMNMPPSGPPIP